MAFPGEIGWIDKNCPDHPKQRLLSKAMQSAAGWFIGTQCDLCREEDPSPHSRETDYYPSKQELIDAALAGTIKWRDSQFRGMKLTQNVTNMTFDAPPEPLSDRYAVICPIHGRQFLTVTNYNAQMSDPDSRWKCPKCGKLAHFDDDTYEKALDALSPDTQGDPPPDSPEDLEAHPWKRGEPKDND